MANFIVYKSGAGSGKTFTLVKEFLRLSLLDENKLHFNFKRILAVTFTNKAAAEMKQRVIDNLSEICFDKSLPAIAQPLMKDLSVDEVELKRRSSILLTSILHNYSELSIGTIDSFTHKIVKTFAFDLDLPVNFSIETDVGSFYDMIISELFSKVGIDPKITSLLKEYALTKAEENSSWDPEKSVRQFVKLLQKEEAPEYTAKIRAISEEKLEEIHQQIRTSSDKFKKEFTAIAEKGLEIIRKNGFNEKDFFGKSRSQVNIFKKCATHKYKPEDFESDGLKSAIENKKWLSVPGPADNEFSDAAHELVEYYENNIAGYRLNELLRRYMHLILLIKKIEEISATKKEEEQIVFISEFNRKIFELINNEPTPFIYERLGERYHHYLLDEFQDTSTLQWQNILPLIDHSLASGWYNLIVGDGKQSIYRWRNANVKQFTELPGILKVNESEVSKERILSLQRNFEPQFLNVNRRSTSTIVEFNNQFFEHMAATLPGDLSENTYFKQAQSTTSEETGYVRIDKGNIPNAEIETMNLDLLLQHVKSSLSSGFEPKDICVITRKKEQGSLAAECLSLAGIPVVSSESLLLQNNKQVNALISFLKFLSDQNDKIAAGVVIEFLHSAKIIDESQFVVSLMQLRENDLFKILSQLNIEANKEELLFGNLFDTCIHISELLKLHQKDELYIRFFLDTVTEFILSGNNDPSEFLEWWESKKEKASVIIPDSSNAVKIMTIHTAKGLEFPVVIIPFCNWQIHHQDETWIDLKSTGSELPVSILKISKQLQSAGLNDAFLQEQTDEALDNLNLLYVAFTRAVERLYVISFRGEKTTMKSVDQWIDVYLNKTEGSSPYEFGELKMSLAKKKKSVLALQLPPLTFCLNSSVITIRSSSYHADQGKSDPILKGIAIHDILSGIKTHSDIESEITQADRKGIITKEEGVDLYKKVTQLLKHPLLEPHYTENTNSITERELITAKGKVLRPDKVSVINGKTFVIDYKSGNRHDKKYESKMMEYEQALLELGYSNVTKILAYVDLNEVIEI